MNTEAEFYKHIIDAIADYLGIILGGEFTDSLLKKTVGDYVKDNQKIWKTKSSLPQHLRDVLEK